MSILYNYIFFNEKFYNVNFTMLLKFRHLFKKIQTEKHVTLNR